MKTSTTRVLSHTGAVLLIALVIWAGSYLGLKKWRGYNVPVAAHGKEFTYVEIGDVSVESTDVVGAFYRPLMVLDAELTGATVIIIPTDPFY